MNLVHPDEVREIFGRCYNEYFPDWRSATSKELEETIRPFKYYLEFHAGVKLDYQVSLYADANRYGFKINQVEVVDEGKFLMFKLRWM